MNIQMVQGTGALQDVAQQSAYLYGVDKTLLPPKQPLPRELMSDGMQQYRQIEGQSGEMPFPFGVDKSLLPPKSPLKTERVAVNGRGRLDTQYQYRQAEGWLGDMPVNFTYLMAYRSYEYTKQIFTKTNWNSANSADSNVNNWLV